MKTVQQFRKYNVDTPTWDQLFTAYDRVLKLNMFIQCSYPGFLVAKPESVWDFQLEKLTPVINEFGVNEAHMYISLVAGHVGYKPHDDVVDVWFWQCQGVSKWTVGGFQYTMNPGDLIFIPAGTEHGVESLSPRAGISMSQVASVIK
jgi:mannose-6-phosphate isomerase-like protein (cupin superfamily)